MEENGVRARCEKMGGGLFINSSLTYLLEFYVLLNYLIRSCFWIQGNFNRQTHDNQWRRWFLLCCHDNLIHVCNYSLTLAPADVELWYTCRGSQVRRARRKGGSK